ncbi:MAG: DUF63 family protein [Methanotrichaceae archaeon]|nr:DUF63 family protein [Methanotrichaceae archaeon]
MSFDLNGWIFKYYVDPIVFDAGYNPINTVTWALILGIMIFVIIRLFQWLEINIDENLVFYTLPYILAGASLRVIEDTEILIPPSKYLLITPIIYFLVFSVTLTSLLVTRKIFGDEFDRPYASIGFIWFGLNLAILTSFGYAYPGVIIAVFLLGSTITSCFYLLSYLSRWLKFLHIKLNLFILYAHMLDASSTYIGIDWFGYHEMHVVPTLFINFLGSARVMFLLKILIILPVLSLIDQSLEDKRLRNLAKLALVTLGLAPAVRNTLRLALGI